MQKKITVLGAGPTGLAAGLDLLQRGLNVRIIEAEDNIGGLCASVRFGDYIFDYGGHRIYDEDESVIRMIEELAGEALTIRERKSSIFINGRFIAYPLRFTNLLRNMNGFTVMAAVADYLFQTVKNTIVRTGEKNLKDWTVNRFGRVLFNIYFKPYTEKFWGLPIEEISIEWASKRITLMGFWDVVSRLLTRRKSVPKTYITRYYYPDGGIGRIFENMAARFTDGGGEIIRSARVTGVETDDGRVRTVVYSRNGEETRLETDYVVSTIPIPELMRAFTPLPEERCLDIAGRLKYRSLIFVFLTVNAEKITDNNWIYFPEKKYLFSRIIEPKNWSASMAPEDSTSLCVEVTCESGDEIWRADDESIREQVAGGLEEAGFLTISDITGCFVVRWRYAYPVYTGTYKEDIRELKDFMSRFGNFKTCGRQGLFHYDNSLEAVLAGLKAGGEASEYLGGGTPVSTGDPV